MYNQASDLRILLSRNNPVLVGDEKHALLGIVRNRSCRETTIGLWFHQVEQQSSLIVMAINMLKGIEKKLYIIMYINNLQQMTTHYKVITPLNSNRKKLDHNLNKLEIQCREVEM